MYSDYHNFLLEANVDNKWISVENGILKVYLRKGKRRIEGLDIDTLDVANLNISNQKLRGKGTFTRFITMLEKEPMPLYIENIENERLEIFLSKRGYTPIYNDFYPHGGIISLLYTNEHKSKFKWN